jgi:O-antigen ligase/tetratricopeptide (TPR) repeat protein
MLLFIHLALSPLLFCRYTADVFEENKVAWLSLTAILLLGIGASAWARGGRQRPVTNNRKLTPSARRIPWKRLLDIPWRDPVLFAVLLYVASAAVSTLNSVNPHTSWRGAVDSSAGLWTVLGYLILFLATRRVCGTITDGRRLLGAAVLGAAVASGYAVLQVLHHDPLEWDGASVFAGYVRPFATMAHPNLLGAYLVMALPLVAAMAERAIRQRRRFAAVAFAVLAVAAVAIIILTISRAAWLAGVCVFAVLLAGWWFARARRAVVVLAAAPILCAVLAVVAYLAVPAVERGPIRETLAQRTRHLGDGAGRWQIWRAAWGVFLDHPLTGSGLDTFRLAFGAERPADYWQQEGDASPTKAHNEILHTLATQGLLGGVALVALFAGLGVAAVRSWRRAAPEDQPFLAAVTACVIGFAVTNVFGFTVVGCGTLFVTCAALLSRWGAQSDEGTAPVIAPVPRGTWGRRLSYLAIAGTMAAAIVFGVVRPLLASLACCRAERLVATNVRASLDEYERAVRLDPGNDRYWTKLSAATQLAARSPESPAGQKHDLFRAKQALDRAVALVPVDPYHHANLGRFLGELACYRLTDPTLSLKEWDAALAADPRSATLLSEAARTAAALGDLGRVRTLASRGLALYPRCAALHAQLGACAFASGCFSEAVATFTEALKGDWAGDDEGPTRALASLSAAHLGLKQFDLARQFADEAAGRAPDWVPPHYLAAQALEGLQKKEEARAEYLRVLRLSPGHAGALGALRRLERK